MAGVNIAGPGVMPGSFPPVFSIWIVELKQDWDDDWKLYPDIVATHCEVHASSREMSHCVMERRYGDLVKMPYDRVFLGYPPLKIDGWWVRLSLVDDQGNATPIFRGLVESSSVNLMGNDLLQSGKQTWIATGGLRLLEKITISKAIFIDSIEAQHTVEWVPAMNKRDHRGLLVGNAATDSDDNTFYGADHDVWNHAQYVHYLVDNFVQQDDGPTWTVAGQTDVIEQMMTTIDFEPAESVASMLRKLIPIHYGVDYRIVSTDDGFEINIFAILAAQIANTLNFQVPSSPTTFRITKNNDLTLLSVTNVQSNERKCDRIEMIGKRIVVCGSLRAARSIHYQPEGWDFHNGPVGASGGLADGGVGRGATLIPKWSPALEAQYFSGNGLDPSQTPVDEIDKARSRELFKDVYQKFGAPVDWDLEDGIWNVACDDQGNVIQADDFQTSIRETLSWIPLKEGFDYTVVPEADNTDGKTDPDVRHPLAWVLDEGPDAPTGGSYVQCDLNGMHISHPYMDWGLEINASPNHKLAHNWFDGVSGGLFDSMNTTSLPFLQYDYSTLVGTIAKESDHRIRLAYDLPPSLAAGDGTVKTLEDHEAEMWVLLPNTIVDVENHFSVGNPDAAARLADSGNKQRILRNDIDRLKLQMAGEVSRYAADRTRAIFTWAGFIAYADLLGQQMSVVQQGQLTTEIYSLITSVVWTLGENPQTTVKVGYAP